MSEGGSVGWEGASGQQPHARKGEDGVVANPHHQLKTGSRTRALSAYCGYWRNSEWTTKVRYCPPVSHRVHRLTFLVSSRPHLPPLAEILAPPPRARQSSNTSATPRLFSLLLSSRRFTPWARCVFRPFLFFPSLFPLTLPSSSVPRHRRHGRYPDRHSRRVRLDRRVPH